MSLVLLDGFEDLTYWPVGGALSGVGTGRTGGNCLLVGTSSACQTLLPTALQTASLTVGGAFKILSQAASAQPNLAFNSDSGTTIHVYAQFNGNTNIYIYGGGVLRATIPAVLPPFGTWFYFEMQAVLSDTVGSVTARLNGVQIADVTGIDTKNAGTKTVFDAVKINAGTVSGGATYSDDIYITNSIDTFWGDIVVETLYPDGMDTTAWIGSDGDTVNNWLHVDDPGTPVDTDYVQSATVAARELYTVQNLSRATGTVPGIYVSTRANKSDSGARGLKVVAKEQGAPTANSVYTSQVSDGGGSGTYVLGAEFTFAVAGQLSGLKFYRHASSAATSRNIRVWTPGGVLLGTATTSGESGSGWHTATLATPIDVSAGTTLRVGYESLASNWAHIGTAASTIVNGPLTRGQRMYTSGSTEMPNTSSTNDYLADVVFQVFVPVIRSTADNALTTTFTDYSLPLEKKAGSSQSVYTSEVPAVSTSIAGVFGADFTTTSAGQITGLRYYRDASATGTSRTMRLWHASGAELANAATSGDTGSGWKTATLSTPVTVTAGQTVRVTYELPADNTIGRTSGAGSTPIVTDPLTRGLCYGDSSGAMGTRPTSTSGFDYFVDIILIKEGSAWTVADVNALAIGVEVGS